MTNVAAALACFLATVIAIASLKPLAVRIDLVDRPGGRKTHHGEVPIIGGLGMFMGFVIGMGLLQQDAPPSEPLLTAMALMVTLGLADDRFDLPPMMRLPIQATAGLVASYGTNTFITTLGDPLGLGEITFSGPTSVAVTLFFFIAAVNAFNMLDGMDGLAGIVATTAFAALSYFAMTVGMLHTAHIAILGVAVTFGFLTFNAPISRTRKVRCFMGDAGSTFLGLLLAWICMRVSQSAATQNIMPTNTLWLVALPIYELVWTFTRRLLRSQSPFKADAEHFHHLMIKAGFSVRATFMMFAILAALLSATGILLESMQATNVTTFSLFIVAGILVTASMYRLDDISKYLPNVLQRTKHTSARVNQ